MINEKEIIRIIEKQRLVYETNIDLLKNENTNNEAGLNSQRGCKSTCNYIIQLIKERNEEILRGARIK